MQRWNATNVRLSCGPNTTVRHNASAVQAKGPLNWLHPNAGCNATAAKNNKLTVQISQGSVSGGKRATAAVSAPSINEYKTTNEFSKWQQCHPTLLVVLTARGNTNKQSKDENTLVVQQFEIIGYVRLHISTGRGQVPLNNNRSALRWQVVA